MSDFDDDDIALAIQLSIRDQQSRATSSKDTPIVIDSSDDEEIVEVTKPNQPRGSVSRSKKLPAAAKPAIPKKTPPSEDEVLVLDTTIVLEDTDTATESESESESLVPKAASTVLEKGKAPALPSTHPTPGKSLTVPSSHDSPTTLSPMTAFRAERIKMEQERLARLKRRRPSPPPVDSDMDGDDEEEVAERPSKRPSPVYSSDSSTTSSNFYGSFNVPDKSGLFWHGALRQTANKHVTPAQDKQPIFRLTSDILPPPSTAIWRSPALPNPGGFG
ncbi:hypothetical protein RSAG8_10827, partial [Rhizoctonia solani AG-8 WAC10335]